MSVKVAVRVRPFNERQKFLGCLNCIQMKDNNTILINPRDRNQKQHQFTFDYSLWSHDGYQVLENGYLYPIDDRYIDQKRIYKQLGQDIINNAWKGYNCCLFAYGQTGAGKSYSMIGFEQNKGILPMACQNIFAGIQKNRIKGQRQFQVHISMLQIYNEKVQDLFVHTSKRPVNGLRIRQNKSMGIYVEALTKYQVYDYKEIQRKMDLGSKNRSLASTLMNQYSSRAHTIVMIQFIQKQFITDKKMNKKSSLLNLVDLAGSERVSKTGISGNKDRLKQASQINKSLHTLGRVIENLAELTLGKGKTVQVPYRQSALTRILETALGGNSVTTMICAVSPANDNYEETLSTLRYADQTKRIKNKPIINESAVDKIIRELRQQNQKLKDMLRIAKMKGINFEETNIEANIQEIQRQIKKNMQSFALNTDNDEDNDDLLLMQSFVDIPQPSQFGQGISSFDINETEKKAYITNLSEDQQLNFKIKYSCENELFVGNKHLKEPKKQKMILCGLGIQERHAHIFHKNGHYYLQPLSEVASQYVYVNGKTVQRSCEILHNDRIIFGTNSVFLFKTDTKLQRKERVDERQIDYEFAVNERNTELLQTSQSSTSSSKGDEFALAKLQQIEREFQELKRENERKMKQKQQKYREQLKKMELQREIQRQKLQFQLKSKEQQATKIVKQKERVERIRDKLLKKEQQRKEKERKLRETMLLDMEEEQLSPTEPTHPTSFTEIPAKTEVKVQYKTEYIDRHHYHYDYNIVQPQIQQKQSKNEQTFNTSSVTAKSHFNIDQSLIAEENTNKNREGKLQQKIQMNIQIKQPYTETESEDKIKKKGSLGIEKTLDLNQHGFRKQKGSQPKIQSQNNLDITNLLYEDKRKMSYNSHKSEQQEQNLLNSTLSNYFPSQPQKLQRKRSSMVSLNLSELSDEANTTNIKEVELQNRIKQLQQKLEELQRSQKTMKQESEKEKVKKSFSQKPNSDNFIDNSLNLSEIAVHQDDESSFEKNLRKNLIQCKNENILNERTIQIRKRKREGDELKKILMKKYKIQINKQLITLIPMIEKFNLWAREMNRNIEGKISIEYHNFTNYEVVQVLKNTSYKNKINIQIKITNYEEGRHYKWPVEVFQNRYQLVQVIFQKYLQNPSSQHFMSTIKEKQKDPFWQPIQFQPYAFAYLSLQCLLYGLQFQGDVSCIHKGKVIGHLNVRVSPIKQKQKKQKISDHYSELQNYNISEEILDPRYLLEKDIFFTIQVNTFVPTQDFSHGNILKYMVSYQIIEGAYKTQKYQTPQRNINNQQIMYMYKHRLKDVSENVLGYLADSPVILTVNVIYDIDDDLSNMTSSFLQMSSSFNTSSIMNLQDSKSSIDFSSPSTVKKKQGIIFENDDVMSKINEDMKKYQSERKKTLGQEQEAKQQIRLRKKKKSRDDKQCLIF